MYQFVALIVVQRHPMRRSDCIWIDPPYLFIALIRFKMMIRCIFLLLHLVPSVLFSQVQFEWVQRASLPGPGRWGAYSFSLNGFAYVAGGNAGAGYFNDAWKYDPLIDSWSQVASMPYGRSHGACFSIGNKAYVVAGHVSGSFYSSDLWEYDPVLDQWTEKAPLPGNARYSPHAFSIGNHGYVGGGNYGSAAGPFLADMYRYDQALDTWTSISGVPGQARYGATSFTIGGHGYVHGGRVASLDFPNELWKFDPSNSSWTAVQSMPGPGRSWMMVMPYTYDAVITGGADNGVASFDAYWYTPTNNAWSSIPDYPGASGWSGASATLLGRPFGGLGRVYLQNTYHTDWWELVKVDGTPVFEILEESVTLRAVPDPASSSFVIAGLKEGSRKEIRIIDLSGSIIHEGIYQGSVDVRMFSSGLYEAVVIEDGRVLGHVKFQVMQE